VNICLGSTVLTALHIVEKRGNQGYQHLNSIYFMVPDSNGTHRTMPVTDLGSKQWILRDDIHFPATIGTKWRKLAGLQHARGIVTLGGAFSNHLHAVAYFGQVHNIPTVGIVRGEHADLGNPTLAFCVKAGMQLLCVRKSDFDHGWQSETLRNIAARFVGYVNMPMGGDSEPARSGAATIVADITRYIGDDVPLQIVIAAGSGTSARGIASALQPLQHCVAVPAAMMHGIDEGPTASLQPITDADRAPLWLPPPHERYAEMTASRLHSIETMFSKHGIVLDPIYSSRAVVAMKHVQDPQQKVATVVVHTGGLQAWAGLQTTTVSAGLRIAIDEALHRAFTI
jgi:1-aminocyclopropane-1-carboxylate deaminase